MDTRFFDPVNGGPAELELRSIDGASFRVLRRIGYHDPAHEQPFVVPAALEEFTTDLTSVPTAFRWLVSQVGAHLLPAVLHDGLVPDVAGQPSHDGPAVDRTEADRIFRDAMIHVGVGRVRAFLMWSAVSVATAWADVQPRWVVRTGLVVTFGSIAVLGVLATLDLLDVWDVLFWMGARPWWQELARGIAFAVLVPLVVSLVWGRRWAQVAIAGVALATLLHVTVVISVITLAYLAVERLVSGPPDRRGGP